MKPDGSEGVQELHFFYDAQSRPAVVEYNDEKYRYIHNLQGDVVGIIDRHGEVVAEYKYDAWGMGLSATGSITTTLENVNPFRYRGYVWDGETKLYYLISRYYSPDTNRFVLADTIIGCVGRILQSNTFAYCCNTPINYYDPEGKILTLFARFFMDKQGREIFNHWMWGFGKKLTIQNSSRWNEYFMNNNNFVAHIKKTVTTAMTQRRADNGHFDETNHLDLSGNTGGGYLKGYELINGTNKDVGDFHMVGDIKVISETEGHYRCIVFARYTIHDIVDPNFSYGFMEKAAWFYCKSSAFYIGGRDYELEINGDINFEIEWSLPR